jgi:hypothetical protein
MLLAGRPRVQPRPIAVRFRDRRLGFLPEARACYSHSIAPEARRECAAVRVVGFPLEFIGMIDYLPYEP